MDIKVDLDLGDNHALEFTSWHPDRDLNPHYADLPDVEKIGAIIHHIAPDGSKCSSGIFFDSEVARKIFSDKSRWQVESWEPLTISPSVLCVRCRDHGFIRGGKWVKA